MTGNCKQRNKCFLFSLNLFFCHCFYLSDMNCRGTKSLCNQLKQDHANKSIPLGYSPVEVASLLNKNLITPGKSSVYFSTMKACKYQESYFFKILVSALEILLSQPPGVMPGATHVTFCAFHSRKAGLSASRGLDY